MGYEKYEEAFRLLMEGGDASQENSTGSDSDKVEAKVDSVPNRSDSVQSDKVIELNNQIIQLQQRKMVLKQQSEQQSANIDKQIMQLKKQVSQFGGICTSASESEKPSFSKKLYESVGSKTTTSIMRDVISSAIESADVSYSMSDTQCNTHARGLITLINTKNFKSMDSDERINEIVSRLRERLENGKHPYSEKEMDRIADEFEIRLGQESAFKWIFE